MSSERSSSGKKSIILRLIINGLISLAFVILGFFLIVNLFPRFSNYTLERGELDWTMLEGFASVISLALLAGGITLAVQEYTGKEDARQAEKLAEQREKAKLSYDIYRAIFDKLTDPEQEAARRWILTNITIKKDDEDIDAWYKKTHDKIMQGGGGNTDEIPEGQKAVKLTLNCFDYIGFIAAHYWEVEADSLDWISAPIAKVWRRLGPYVEQVRTLRNTTDYYSSAQHVGELCIQWRKDKGMADEEIAKNTV
ncbi:MAG TPA: hypothetical protein VK851_03700 [Anaerolineales bacterium]|nr:hypothetical protein [Anaerolineales bacterium]